MKRWMCALLALLLCVTPALGAEPDGDIRPETEKYMADAFAMGLLDEGYRDYIGQPVTAERLQIMADRVSEKLAVLTGLEPVEAEVTGTSRWEVNTLLRAILGGYGLGEDALEPVTGMPEGRCGCQEAVAAAVQVILNCYDAQDAGSRGLLWRAVNGENTLYLLGTVHMDRGNVYPLHRELRQVIQGSEHVILEIELGDEEGVAEFAAMQRYSDGTTLDQHISKDLYDRTVAALAQEGLTESTVRRYKPWALANALGSILSQDDSTGELSMGIDTYVDIAASWGDIPILGVETYAFQGGIFDSLSEGYQIAYLEANLRAVETGSTQMGQELDTLMECWKTGDTQGFEVYYNKKAIVNSGDELNAKLFTDRDPGMIEAAREYLELEGAHTNLMAVGAGHMVAPGGIVPGLQALGYRVEPVNGGEEVPEPAPAPALPALVTDSHEKYINGGADGLFRPWDGVTWPEAAQMLYNCFAEAPDVRLTFTDVEEDAWYATAVETLGGLGLIAPDSQGRFGPERYISRGELAMLVAPFLPHEPAEPVSFPDLREDYAGYEAICRCVSQGIFYGWSDGNFYPGGALTRAEAVAVFNRLLGREADRETIDGSREVRRFPDVPKTFWAYYDITEAATSHGFERGEEGEESWTWITPAPRQEFDLTMTFAGDCLLAAYKDQVKPTNFNGYFANYGPDYFLQNVRDIFEGDDFTIVNLENVVSDTPGLKEIDKGGGTAWWFKAGSFSTQVLTGSSVEAVSIANNHTTDYGTQGYLDTVAALDGAGMTWGDESKTFYLEKEGFTVAVICTCMWTGSKVTAIAQRIQEAEALSDFQVVFFHGGSEGTHTPEAWKVKACHQLVDAGADLVVGAHPHVLQYRENYNGVDIVYSLGNFCFGGNIRPENRTALYRITLTVGVDGTVQETAGEIIPCYVYTGAVNNLCPAVITDEVERQRVLDFMAGARALPY